MSLDEERMAALVADKAKAKTDRATRNATTARVILDLGEEIEALERKMARWWACVDGDGRHGRILYYGRQPTKDGDGLWHSYGERIWGESCMTPHSNLALSKIFPKSIKPGQCVEISPPELRIKGGG